MITSFFRTIRVRCCLKGMARHRVESVQSILTYGISLLPIEFPREKFESNGVRRKIWWLISWQNHCKAQVSRGLGIWLWMCFQGGKYRNYWLMTMIKYEKQIRSQESLAHYKLCTTGVCWSYLWGDNNSTYRISTEIYYSTSTEYENVLFQFARNSGIEY